MCSHCIIGKGVTFFDEVKVAFAHLEEHLYVPYADILEMPINFCSIPCLTQCQAQEISYRHLFQPA